MATIDRPSSAVTFARLRAVGSAVATARGSAARGEVGLALAVFLAWQRSSYWGAGSLSTWACGISHRASDFRRTT